MPATRGYAGGMTHGHIVSLALLSLVALTACKEKTDPQAAAAGPAASEEPAAAAESTGGPGEVVGTATSTTTGETGAAASTTETGGDGTGGSETGEAPAQVPVRFWVADAGMRAFDLDGKELEVIGRAKGPIRRLADGRFVFYERNESVLRVGLMDASGKVLRRAMVPKGFEPDTCALIQVDKSGKEIGKDTGKDGTGTGAGEGQESGEEEAGEEEHWERDPLEPQSHQDFRIDARGGQVCLRIQDRNDNMSDVAMLVAMSLDSLKVGTRITLDVNQHCNDKGDLAADLCKDDEWGEPWIEGTPAPTVAATWPFDYREDKHTLMKGSKAVGRLCAEGADDDENAWGRCAEIESRSPSDRWILLSGVISEGDYIHRDLLLLDRSDGKLWQVVDPYDGKPSFAETSAAAHFASDGGEVLNVVGESEIEWLPQDRLWIDGRLLIPESRTIHSIGGSLVRTL